MDTGSRLVNEAGQTMGDIVDSIVRVTDIMGEITSATHEQTLGIEQINMAIAQMDEVTQQNAALVEEAAAASQSMQEQAGELAHVVGFFKTGHAVAAPKLAAVRSRAPAKAAPARHARHCRARSARPWQMRDTAAPAPSKRQRVGRVLSSLTLAASGKARQEVSAWLFFAQNNGFFCDPNERECTKP